MSEYQWIEFVAVDGPVEGKDLEFMERQSSRAEVTPWRFTNEYHYGEFGGQTDQMLRRGYDMHLHFSKFGIRRLVIRLPQLSWDRKLFRKYELSYELTWKKDKRGPAGLLSFEPEGDADRFDYLDDSHSILDRLAPIREMLIAGDLRPLFLAWLACDCEDDEPVPPIPAGLENLEPSLQTLLEFYEIPDDYLDSIIPHSPAMPDQQDRQGKFNRWLGKKKKAELQVIAAELIQGNNLSMRRKLIQDFRSASSIEPWPTVSVDMCLGDVRNTACN